MNAADDPAACSFLFPALVQRGRFCAGLCTGGASPTAAARLRARLEAQLPSRLEDILDWLEEQRPAVKAVMPDQSRRAAALQALCDGCLERGRPLTPEEARACVEGGGAGGVALVGAGCGKADLISLRGLRLLEQCQAVVYDGLIDPALLDYAPESAQRIYVGKRCGAHSTGQEEINGILIQLARAGLRVVRLKGGDPYLFGRGGEEMQALQAAGVPCVEVPGIPSAIGIPAEAGIPVTHRGISRGVHIVTGHTAGSPDGLPPDLDRLAGLDGTLVFLMGLGQLPAIARRLMDAGLERETPAAVISGGNAPSPAVVRASLADIAGAAAHVRAPAVVVVGETAAMDLTAPALPLIGVRVGVTGTAGVARRQRTALEALGCSVFWAARAAVRPRRPAPAPETLGDGGGWLVFTSANGVQVFFDGAAGTALRSKGPGPWKFAVIGPATGEALAQYGITAHLCPSLHTSQGLAQALAAVAQPGEEAVLLRSSGGSPVLPQVLEAAGLRVRDIPLYDVEAEDPTYRELPALDYLTFSSAGGVELFFRQYGGVPAGVRCAAIGPVTAQALAEHGVPVLAAEDISAAGLVRAVQRDWAARQAPAPHSEV